MSQVHLLGDAWGAASARARALIAGTGFALRLRDLDVEPLTWHELRWLAGLAGGVRHLVSVQAPRYRLLGREAATLAEPDLLGLMAADPTLVRRPIVRLDDLVLVGFSGRPDTPGAGQ